MIKKANVLAIRDNGFVVPCNGGEAYISTLRFPADADIRHCIPNVSVGDEILFVENEQSGVAVCLWKFHAICDPGPANR